MAIVNCDKWKDALRNETKDLKTGYRNTPTRKLIRKMPGTVVTSFEAMSTLTLFALLLWLIAVLQA